MFRNSLGSVLAVARHPCGCGRTVPVRPHQQVSQRLRRRWLLSLNLAGLARRGSIGTTCISQSSNGLHCIMLAMLSSELTFFLTSPLHADWAHSVTFVRGKSYAGMWGPGRCFCILLGMDRAWSMEVAPFPLALRLRSQDFFAFQAASARVGLTERVNGEPPWLS